MTAKWRTERPGSDEHATFYAGYIADAPGGDLVETMRKQGDAFASFVRGIPEAKGDYRYAEGKWSIKDVVLHICDAERVFSYRLMRFSRNDATDLPGFDEGPYVKHGEAGKQTLAQLAAQWDVVRRSSLALIEPMGDEAMNRRGTANGHGISARALAWVLAGHAVHHEKVIKERYL